MWRALQAVMVVLLMCVTAVPSQKTEKAGDILKAAKLKAVEQNKSIFLFFGASWSDASHQFETFLELPEVATILDKYFVVAKLTFGESAAGHADWDTPGADNLIAKYNGINSRGEATVPFIVILDQKTNLIANSIQPGKQKSDAPTTGFPAEPEDIKWFLSVLHKGASNMTDDELAKLQSGLLKAASQ